MPISFEDPLVRQNLRKLCLYMLDEGVDKLKIIEIAFILGVSMGKAYEYYYYMKKHKYDRRMCADMLKGGDFD